MFKYKAYSEKIEKIEIIKETESSIWTLNNRRQNKTSSYENYFDTFKEAKNHLIKIKTDLINSHKRQIIYIEKDLEKINSIKEF